jgi:probable rRNA maturation factor
MEMVVKQAEEYGHSVDREIAFLVSHSVYHLLGFDHENEENGKHMFEKQEKILMKMGLKKYI